MKTNTRAYYKELYDEWATTGTIRNHSTITCTRCSIDVNITSELSMSQLRYGNRICKKCLNKSARQNYIMSHGERMWQSKVKRLLQTYGARFDTAQLKQVYTAFQRRCVISNIVVDPRDAVFVPVNRLKPLSMTNIMLIQKGFVSVIEKASFKLGEDMKERIAYGLFNI